MSSSTHVSAEPGLSRPMHLAWGIVALIACVDVIGCLGAGLKVSLTATAPTLAIGLALLAAAAVYSRLRPDPKIAAMFQAAGFLVFATLALAIASYVGATLALPLQDKMFDAIDVALGFDFPSHYAFVAAHPSLAVVLDLCYNTSLIQVALAVLALAMTGQINRLHAFLLLFTLTATAVICVATIMPTLGTYAFYAVPDTGTPAFNDARSGWQHLGHLTALRDGTMRAIPFDDIRGLIAFPSFHTALAIVTSWALMQTRFVWLPVLMVNVVLIVATPTLGSHYLCDILGGAAIALGAIALVTGFQRQPARAVTLPLVAAKAA